MAANFCTTVNALVAKMIANFHVAPYQIRVFVVTPQKNTLFSSNQFHLAMCLRLFAVWGFVSEAIRGSVWEERFTHIALGRMMERNSTKLNDHDNGGGTICRSVLGRTLGLRLANEKDRCSVVRSIETHWVNLVAGSEHQR